MKKTLVYAFLMLTLTSAARAQQAPPTTSQMDHVDPGASAAGRQGDAPMNHGAMSYGEAPADARDPHAYSGGYDQGPLQLPHGEHRFGSLLVENLESVRADDEGFTAYDLQGWYGTTYDRAVVKAEGEIDGGELHDARTELLWGHAIAPFWDGQIGVRHDSGEGPDVNWLAVGVQGLAPYWFELEAFGYVGEEGRTAVRLDASYELLLTQKAILQPRVEANLYGKQDAARGLGSGLSDITAGLRLRYEIRREFAPYIGIEYAVKVGGSADFARAAGEDTRETRVVAGVRFWF